MKKRHVLILSLFFINCISKKTELNIYPLSPFSRVNKFNDIIQKEVYYIVYNYSSDEIDEGRLKNFAFSRITLTDSIFNDFKVVFYKASSLLDTAYRERPEDLLDWHSKSKIADFTWNKGKYLGSFKYKNGTILSKTVEVTEIPSSK